MTSFDEDTKLFKWYIKGFRDELRGTSSIVPKDEDMVRAYRIGARDVLIGDEVSSNDERSYDDIIEELRNE